MPAGRAKTYAVKGHPFGLDLNTEDKKDRSRFSRFFEAILRRSFFGYLDLESRFG
jgi:hypothetical protein